MRSEEDLITYLLTWLSCARVLGCVWRAILPNCLHSSRVVSLPLCRKGLNCRPKCVLILEMLPMCAHDCDAGSMYVGFM